MERSDRSSSIHGHLLHGQVIPAHPLALTSNRTLDERHQRALTRYYIDAGAGGIAVGVHTTQFAIRQHQLYRPVLELAMETSRSWRASSTHPFAHIAGVIGDTKHAVAEAETARALGYDVALLSLGAMKHASDSQLITHCRHVAEVLPLFGFYLQPAVGGRVLSYAFWRELVELQNVWAIKIAPFNRYQTLDVVRAVADSGRRDIALYTGNDDSIIPDLLTPYPGNGKMVGGLLGQWAVWTHQAVALLRRAQAVRGHLLDASWLTESAALTDANGAIFDTANGFAGCIAGIHEILCRQGLLQGIWCLDANEGLSAGQSAEIDRVCRDYPMLADDAFVREHLDRWLR
ncbi:MAG: dihydrodipicolinate synthetase [Gemmatimonadetes bacterium]|nr:dihydrodipicolinate synthetase [Gemmatimonadota bacterium]